MSPFTLLEEGTCVKECSTGFYQFGNLCSHCDPTCLTCDVSPYVCTSCSKTSAYPFLYNNQCVKQCQTGYYQNPETYTCDQCQWPCLSCQSGTNDCTSCQSGFYLFRGTCRAECPADYFIGNPVTWNCDQCTNNCNTCEVSAISLIPPRAIEHAQQVHIMPAGLET